jgi:NTE family protein
MKKQKSKWALVLSGGGARGLAHVGILKGLEKMKFPKPSLVVGTSMGSIIGGLYACGMSPAELEKFAIEGFRISDYLDSFVFKIDGPVGRVIQTGQSLASLAARHGVDSGQRVLDLLEKLTAKKKIEDAVIPFRCNAVDLLSGREVVFASGSVAKAMRASMSLPIFFEPYHYEGMCFVDGGVVDNMPVGIAHDEGFEKILAVNVNSFAPVKNEDIRNGPQVIFRSIECVLHNQEKQNTQAELTLNVTVHADIFSFFKQRELIELGVHTVNENLDALKVFFDKKAKAQK